MRQLDEKRCFDCSLSKQEMLKCSRCHAAWYCDAKCQKKDFKSHKGLCKEIGNLLAEINGENYLNQHESIRKFVSENSKDDLQLWQQMVIEIPKLPDIMVKICRKFQPLYILYLDVASRENSRLPAEVALEWLNKALKIVAYHTEHFATMKKKDNKEKRSAKSSNDANMDRFKRLYFGGDMNSDGKPKELKAILCKTREPPEDHPLAHIYDCRRYAVNVFNNETQPDGPADPFFCFGGVQNIPEVLVFLGRYQDAMNYIWHWSDGRFYDTYTPGAIIKRWKDWVSGNFNYDDMYKSSELVELGIRNWRKFAGEPDEGKNLMRVYGLIILIRLHTLLNADGIPDFKRKEASLDLMINPGMMTLTDSYMYYVTGREELISQMTLFKMSKGHTCRSDPRKEIHRLVWDLYKRLSQEEANFLGESYEKCIASARSWLF